MIDSICYRRWTSWEYRWEHNVPDSYSVRCSQVLVQTAQEDVSFLAFRVTSGCHFFTCLLQTLSRLMPMWRLRLDIRSLRRKPSSRLIRLNTLLDLDVQDFTRVAGPPPRVCPHQMRQTTPERKANKVNALCLYRLRNRKCQAHSFPLDGLILELACQFPLNSFAKLCHEYNPRLGYQP